MEVKRGVMFRKERVACSTGNKARRLVATGWLVATGAFFFRGFVPYTFGAYARGCEEAKGTRTLMDENRVMRFAAFVIRMKCGTRK